MARQISMRAITSVSFVCFSPLLCVATPGIRFRGSGVDSAQNSVIGTRAVEASVKASLQMIVHGGDSEAARRLPAIEASLWHTFQAMPKNEMGRLAPRSVRHMVHSFFAKEHGWLIKGLEPHGMQVNVSEVHEVSILQDKAPYLVEALLEARQAGHGLSLADIVAMVATLEHLIFDESVGLLESSYFLNEASPAEHLDEQALHEVLTSYLLIFEMGARGNLSDPGLHQAMKEKVMRLGGSWEMLVEFEKDAVWNYLYKFQGQVNPFEAARFSFEAASNIVADMAQDYGKWQNLECRAMKDDLMSLDTTGSGLIPLNVFYSQPDTADYQFTESVDYLRDIGALDLSNSGTPNVRIANYLAGPSNCIASHTYYSVCCLSECEGWMNELEGKVQSPTASPEHLLDLVANLSSADYALERVTPQLRARLHAIGQHHGGQVPLHGRMFAQWLHYAFPNDCPFPHMVEDAAVLTPAHWAGSGTNAITTSTERQMHADQTDEVLSTMMEHTVHEWSHDEVLPLNELVTKPSRGAFASCVRVAVQLVMFLVVLRTAIAAWQAASSAAGGRVGKWKKDDNALSLPIHMSQTSRAAFV